MSLYQNTIYMAMNLNIHIVWIINYYKIYILYKSWSVVFIVATFLLSHIREHIIIIIIIIIIIRVFHLYWLSIAKLILCGQHDALHAIINSNYLLSILKALSTLSVIYIYIYIYAIYFATQSLSHIIHLFYTSSFPL